MRTTEIYVNVQNLWLKQISPPLPPMYKTVWFQIRPDSKYVVQVISISKSHKPVQGSLLMEVPEICCNLIDM